MSFVDELSRVWNDLLALLNRIVVPDWGALVTLIPVFLLVLVVGPGLTLLVLLHLVHFLRQPRLRVVELDPVRPLPRGPDGRLAIPTAEPVCTRDGLVFSPGETRCRVCGDLLTLVCPKCGLARAAVLDACGNCGLVIRFRSTVPLVAPAPPPPPGGAAAA